MLWTLTGVLWKIPQNFVTTPNSVSRTCVWKSGKSAELWCECELKSKQGGDVCAQVWKIWVRQQKAAASPAACLDSLSSGLYITCTHFLQPGNLVKTGKRFNYEIVSQIAGDPWSKRTTSFFDISKEIGVKRRNQPFLSWSWFKRSPPSLPLEKSYNGSGHKFLWLFWNHI